jgi:hypothetical protein
LKLAPPRTPGYDATRERGGKIACIQIKGRACKADKTQHLSKFNLKTDATRDHGAPRYRHP